MHPGVRHNFPGTLLCDSWLFSTSFLASATFEALIATSKKNHQKIYLKSKTDILGVETRTCANFALDGSGGDFFVDCRSNGRSQTQRQQAGENCEEKHLLLDAIAFRPPCLLSEIMGMKNLRSQSFRHWSTILWIQVHFIFLKTYVLETCQVCRTIAH